MNQPSFLSLLLICFLPIRLFAELTPQDTLTINRLFGEAYAAHSEGRPETAYLKLDSLIQLGFEKGSGYFAIGIGLGYKAKFADENNHLNDYYEAIKKTDDLLPAYMNQLGESGTAIQINNAIRLGHYYKRRGSFLRARDQFSDTYESFGKPGLLSNLQATTLLLHLGAIHKSIGNYHLALTYALESRDSFLAGNPQDYSVGFEGLICKNIADIYTEMGQQDSASLFYQQAIELIKGTRPKDRDIRNRLISIHHGFAEFLINKKDFAPAIELLEKSLSLHITDDPFYEETFRLMGGVFSKKGDLKKAKEYFKKSKQAIRYESKNYQVAMTYLAEGNMYADFNDYGNALAAYQKALTNLDDQFNETANYCQNPSNFDSVFAKKVLLETLHRKAVALFKNGDGKCAFETVQLAIHLVANISKDNSSDYDKQVLLTKNYPLFEDAMEISLAQPDGSGVAFAVEVAERSKSILLLKAVRNSQITDYNVPDSLLDAEQQLKFYLHFLEEKKYEASRSGQLSSDLDQSIADTYKKLEDLNNDLKNSYRPYYEMRNDHHVDNLAQLSGRLQKGQALIEYFWGENSGRAFLLLNDGTVEFYEMAIPPDSLAEVVQGFLHAIYLPFANENSRAAQLFKKKEYADSVFAQSGFHLYQALFGPFRERLEEKGIRQLVVIPDGVLNYLPFDALLQNEVPTEMVGFYDNKNDYRFMAHDYRISYCYSATLLGLMQKGNDHRPQQQRGILAFDVFEPWSERQTQAIYNIFDRFWLWEKFVNLLGAASHEESLGALGPQYQYLHFATHGIIDNERPHQSNLILRPTSTNQDSLLYLRSIYGLELPARMVFTSSCNAGIGHLAKGEGLLSLARGFSYAGAQSLVTTLWAVNIDGANLLVSHFYKNLHNGMPKDKALFLAKKELLAEPLTAHPYYWAGFVPIGDMAAIDAPCACPIWWLLAGLVLVAYFVFRKRTRGKGGRS